MGFLEDCADAFREGRREAGANMRRGQEGDRALRSPDEPAREEMRDVNGPRRINLRNRGVNVAALTEARCMPDARQPIKGPCRAAPPASAKPSSRLMGRRPLTSRGKVPKRVLEFRPNCGCPAKRHIGAGPGHTADAVLHTADARVGKGGSCTDYRFRTVDGDFTPKSTVGGEIPCACIWGGG